MNDKQLYPNCDVKVWLRSCTHEIIEPLQGKVSGTIPLWLNGVLIRNGPGSLKVGDYTYRHLFDSAAVLHRFAIENGNVTYQCRFLQSEAYKRNKKANRIVVSEFGTCAVPDPCHTIYDRVATFFNWKDGLSDNTNISVYPFGDELYAFNESSVIHRINQETLNTEGKINMNDHIAIVNHTSHPHVLSDGSVYNAALTVSTNGPNYNIVHFPKKPENCDEPYSMFEKANIVATLPVRWPLHPSYMHTFGITENYFIIVEQPFSLSLPRLVKAKLVNTPLIGAFQWYNDETTQILVIDKQTGNLTFKYQAKAFFYLHIINQYESGNHIVLDICSYDNPHMIDCMYVDAMNNMQTNPDYANMFRSKSVRFVLPLINNETILNTDENLVTLSNTAAEAYLLTDGNILVKPEKLCDLGCETPRINYEKYLGKSYQFYYAINADVDAEYPGTIIKVDTHSKTTLIWRETNCYPSEPIFIPSPNSQFEDDGIILAAMVWCLDDTNHVGLIILDAKTFTEIGRAEFQTPGPIPKCLHGWFLPNDFNNK